MSNFKVSTQEQSQLLQAQLDDGFRRLRFDQPLESDFKAYQTHVIQRRVGYVGLFSIVLLTLYACVDFLFLPDRIWEFTVMVRATMIVPVIILAYALFKQEPKPNTIINATFICYMMMGIGVIAIIGGSQLGGYDIPYEGLYSVILFGFFLLGLPFKLILFSTWGMWWLFGCMELLVGHTENLLPELFFLASMCAIGTVGSYLHEHTLRSGYLKHRLVKLSQQQAVADKEAKTQFLAAAGHDLRQPINAISLISDALAQTLIHSNPQQQVMTERLTASVDMLNRLLDSLLEYSRLEMGEVEPYWEKVPLDALTHEVVSAMTTQLEAAHIKIHLHVATPAYVKTDPLLFERILRNLISNVIQHAKASEIHISTAINNQTLTLEIKDNGCGISKEHQEAIFDQYYQVTPNRERGMGLGLSIVQQLADILNIRLSVTSQLNEGTCFLLSVDCLEQAPLEHNHQEQKLLKQNIQASSH